MNPWSQCNYGKMRGRDKRVPRSSHARWVGLCSGQWQETLPRSKKVDYWHLRLTSDLRVNLASLTTSNTPVFLVISFCYLNHKIAKKSSTQKRTAAPCVTPILAALFESRQTSDAYVLTCTFRSVTYSFTQWTQRKEGTHFKKVLHSIGSLGRSRGWATRGLDILKSLIHQVQKAIENAWKWTDVSVVSTTCCPYRGHGVVFSVPHGGLKLP